MKNFLTTKYECVDFFLHFGNSKPFRIKSKNILNDKLHLFLTLKKQMLLGI